MPDLRKYPRTPHIEGSRLQPGDEDLEAVPCAQLVGRHLVVEEKLDGANAAVSYSSSSELLLQSRGHYLTGGPRERHFDLFKTWARCHQAVLHDLLGSCFVMYGEWLFARHTIYYDALPHYFVEFDVLDRRDDVFLSTERRQHLLAGTPVVSAPVLWTGRLGSAARLPSLVGPSRFHTPIWPESSRQSCLAAGVAPDVALSETDTTDLMEGLYIKVEQDGRVVSRYKYVRGDFLTAVLDSGTHWLNRPIIPNRLRDGVDLCGSVGE